MANELAIVDECVNDPSKCLPTSSAVRLPLNYNAQKSKRIDQMQFAISTEEKNLFEMKMVFL